MDKEEYSFVRKIRKLTNDAKGISLPPEMDDLFNVKDTVQVTIKKIKSKDKEEESE